MTFPCSSPCAKATVLISEASLMHWNATSSINSSSSVGSWVTLKSSKNCIYIQNLSYTLNWYIKHQTVGSALDLFQPLSEWRHSTPTTQANSAHPDVCSKNGSLYKNMKKTLWTERKRATIEDRGGICWHCIKCNAEVFEAQRGQVFCQSMFLVLLLYPAQTTKGPLRQPLLFFFFSEQAHKASYTMLQLSSTERTKSSHLHMHLFSGSAREKKHC